MEQFAVNPFRRLLEHQELNIEAKQYIENFLAAPDQLLFLQSSLDSQLFSISLISLAINPRDPLLAAFFRDLKPFILKLDVSLFDITLGLTPDCTLRKEYFSCLQKPYKDLSMKVYESQYDFERWYNQVKELSIESQIIQTTKEQAEDMLLRGVIIDQILYETIEKAISELGGSVFAKFRRSPKDHATQSLSDENPMKIQTVRELLTLVSHSDRLKEDLNFPHPLILRKWESDVGIEFRCFICNQQLNEVTLQPNQQELSDKDRGLISDQFNSQEIIEVFKEKIGKVLYPHCVVDVGLMMSGDGIKMRIIEINPFGKMAQSGYFSWVIDRDILFEGFSKTGKVCIRFERQ